MTWIIKHWDAISVTVCLLMYALTAAIRWSKGDMPMALVFGAYAVANVGFIWHFCK